MESMHNKCIQTFLLHDQRLTNKAFISQCLAVGGQFACVLGCWFVCFVSFKRKNCPQAKKMMNQLYSERAVLTARIQETYHRTLTLIQSKRRPVKQFHTIYFKAMLSAAEYAILVQYFCIKHWFESTCIYKYTFNQHLNYSQKS